MSNGPISLSFYKNGRLSKESGDALRLDGLRWCCKCKSALPVSSFYKSKKRRDGLGDSCKPCHSKRTGDWAKTQAGRLFHQQAGRDWYKHHKDRRAIYSSSPKGRYSFSKAQAKHRGKEFSISRDYYCSLIDKPCEYCGLKVDAVGIGLDRLDNSKGYLPGNVVPCCWCCNTARNDYWTYEEMKTILGPAIRKAQTERGVK